MAFSPDGQRLASGSSDQTVRIWDSVTGKELLALKGHAGSVWSVAFSPDGQRLASASQEGSIHLWETTSVSPELQHRRATNQMVADIFRQMHLRADVLERLRTLPGMSTSRRQEVLAVAQTYSENPHQLNELALQLVKLPGGEMTGYRKALRYSEEACQLVPEDGTLLNTLGVAYYRAGNYEKALDVLSRSDKINSLRDKGSHPSDLAFLAMAHQQLGHAKEAEAALQLLRERIKDPRWRRIPSLKASFAKRKNCWQNPSRPAASERTWLLEEGLRLALTGVGDRQRDAPGRQVVRKVAADSQLVVRDPLVRHVPPSRPRPRRRCCHGPLPRTGRKRSAWCG